MHLYWTQSINQSIEQEKDVISINQSINRPRERHDGDIVWMEQSDERETVTILLYQSPPPVKLSNVRIFRKKNRVGSYEI